jgi:hypothetical protein
MKRTLKGPKLPEIVDGTAVALAPPEPSQGANTMNRSIVSRLSPFVSFVSAVSVVSLLSLAACGAGATGEQEEEVSTEESEQGIAVSTCLGNIRARAGSDAWVAAVQRCIDEAKAGRQIPGRDAQAPVADAGRGQRCTVSVSCNGGACVCGAGPRAGKSCASAQCSDFCKFCE